MDDEFWSTIARDRQQNCALQSLRPTLFLYCLAQPNKVVIKYIFSLPVKKEIILTKPWTKHRFSISRNKLNCLKLSNKNRYLQITGCPRSPISTRFVKMEKTCPRKAIPIRTAIKDISPLEMKNH